MLRCLAKPTEHPLIRRWARALLRGQYTDSEQIAKRQRQRPDGKKQPAA
jgi:hypothetical protein